jgi:hypothetical protein
MGLAVDFRTFGVGPPRWLWGPLLFFSLSLSLLPQPPPTTKATMMVLPYWLIYHRPKSNKDK